jgi:hypothetical protein
MSRRLDQEEVSKKSATNQTRLSKKTANILKRFLKKVQPIKLVKKKNSRYPECTPCCEIFFIALGTNETFEILRFCIDLLRSGKSSQKFVDTQFTELC